MARMVFQPGPRWWRQEAKKEWKQAAFLASNGATKMAWWHQIRGFCFALAAERDFIVRIPRGI